MLKWARSHLKEGIDFLCRFGFWTDEAFTTDMDREEPWWTVDLLIKTKIHMVRIVTAVGYKKSDFEGLELKVGTYSYTWPV